MKKVLAVIIASAMVLSLAACGGGKGTGSQSVVSEAESSKSVISEPEKTAEPAETTPKTEEENTPTPEPEPSSEESAEPVDGMRPEFKEAMDSYEAFYSEYCDLMKKYTANPSDLDLLTQYGEMVSKAAEMGEKLDAWDEDEMNAAETAYCLEVQTRVTKKLLEAAQ